MRKRPPILWWPSTRGAGNFGVSSFKGGRDAESMCCYSRQLRLSSPVALLLRVPRVPTRRYQVGSRSPSGNWGYVPGLLPATTDPLTVAKSRLWSNWLTVWLADLVNARMEPTGQIWIYDHALMAVPISTQRWTGTATPVRRICAAGDHGAVTAVSRLVL
jgi:hypothetical protein